MTLLLLAACHDTKPEGADSAPCEPVTWYGDGDGDGYGGETTLVACEADAGFVATAGDCDDDDPAVSPAAIERCDGTDDDCNGAIDDAADAPTWYADADADGFGDAESGAVACDAPSNSVADATDCDDTDDTISPAATEICDGVDNDCDAAIDEDIAEVPAWYVDADGDGYGAGEPVWVCTPPDGHVGEDGDCDDADPTLNPAADDVCGDGIDNDCDGTPECPFTGSYAETTADRVYTGAAAGDVLWSMALGDFDGDGTTDLLGGLPGYDTTGSFVGSAVVWYGPDPSPGTAYGTGGTMLYGDVSYAGIGYDVAAADHDGDGVDDLVVGSYGGQALFLVYGGALPTYQALADTTDVATIQTESRGQDFAQVVAGSGDVNGDGTEEILVTASGYDSAVGETGRAYLLYGSSTRRSGASSASDADTIFEGANYGDYVGWSCAFVPDMDGDGLDEVLVGAIGVDTHGLLSGEVYLYLGSSTPWSGVRYGRDADATWWGTAVSERLGSDVSGLGDVTGDGYGDAGAHGDGYGGEDGFGDVGPWAGELRVYEGGTSASFSSPVATLYGESGYTGFGRGSVGPGDIDGDGTGDLLVGVQSSDTEGQAALWFGPVSGTLGVTTADVLFYGSATADGYFGENLPARAGDLTGDGVDDILVGSPRDTTMGEDAGAIYVWCGREY